MMALRMEALVLLFVGLFFVVNYPGLRNFHLTYRKLLI